ncbi:MAG: CCA tRNA nucleotidyltransferase [Bdellovibrionales bacterium]|nr:CCA tRNA nucleotidyltransferase [Bdellovibrionales bacterium]
MDRAIFTSHSDWPEVEEILKKIQSQGFKAVLVGGCVRDALIEGKRASSGDLDIATDATPEDIQALFDRVEMVGKSFGVSMVVINKKSFEVSTFREDSQKSDGRHPESVKYTTIDKDVYRRDFTVNAIYYDPLNDQLMDFVGGVEDVQNKILKAVGDPDVRFKEDYLRILRGLRFSAILEFAIEPKTFEAMKNNVPGLSSISMERVKMEFDSVLGRSGSPRNFRKLFFESARDLGVMAMYFDMTDYNLSIDNNEVTPKSIPQAWQDFIKRADKANWNYLQGWMHLYLYRYRFWRQKTGSPGEAEVRLKTEMDLMKLANSEKEQIWATIKSGALWVKADQIQLEDLFVWGRQKEKGSVDFWRTEVLAFGKTAAHFEKLDHYFKEYFEAGQLPQPLVKGDDLIKMGVSSGPEMKTYLEAAHKKQFLEKITDKKILLQHIQKLIN